MRDTFVKSREARQKSTIVRLVDGGGELCVQDRGNLSDVSNCFRAFLGADRRTTPSDPTRHIVESAKKAALKNPD